MKKCLICRKPLKNNLRKYCEPEKGEKQSRCQSIQQRKQMKKINNENKAKAKRYAKRFNNDSVSIGKLQGLTPEQISKNFHKILNDVYKRKAQL